MTTLTLLSGQKDINTLTRIYQEGLRASGTRRGGGSRWPMASVCHPLNHLPDSRAPAALDPSPRPGGPVLGSRAPTLSALQQTAADASAQLHPSPTGTQGAEQTPHSSPAFLGALASAASPLPVP